MKKSLQIRKVGTCLLLICAIFCASRFAEGKTTLQFKIKPDRLRTTTDIANLIRHRLESLGIEDVGLVIIGTDQVRLDLPKPELRQLVMDALSRKRKVEFQIMDQGKPVSSALKITGDMIQDMHINTDQSFPTLVITFDDKGKKILEDMTAQNTGKQAAFFLDGEMLQSAYIREAITKG